MGWWSEYIMGGDTPLDDLGILSRVCGVDYDMDEKHEYDDTFHGYPLTRAALEKHRGELVEEVQKSGDWSKPVMGQVLGAMFLWAGAELTDDMKDLVVSCAESDEWMSEEIQQYGSEGGDRTEVIRAFIAKVRDHKPGVRVTLDDVGLLQRLAQRGADNGTAN